jgi:DNA-binding transcriptional regulator GbsR (MarR family)
MGTQEIENEIYSTFSDIASSLGYSEVHGRIIGALLVAGGELSLDELAKKTGYSLSTISLSLEMLTLLDIIRKLKVPGDRKLYIKLQGSLMEGLKNAIVLKAKKSAGDTLQKFEGYRERIRRSGDGEKRRLLKSIDILEKEVRKLEKYISLVSKVRL